MKQSDVSLLCIIPAMKTIQLFAFLNILICTQVCAQFGTLSFGGEAKDGLSTVSFSIGQTFYLPSNVGSITPGLQQPYILVTILTFDNTISIYPNPFTGYVTLKIGNSNYANYHFEIYDLSGKLLISNNVQNIETTIVLIDFAKAVYICKIFLNNIEVNIFKIVKT